MEQNRQIIALGFFDGVHVGHQALLKACRELADETGCRTAAITFDKHPQSLFTGNPPPLLNTAADRQRLLRRYGIETVYTYPVTKAVMSTPWQDFLEALLARGAAGFVCGYDFRFGDHGEGDGARLRQFCDARGLPCVIVPELTVDGIRVSSTHIRSLLERGEMERAVRFLGHPHILSGTVVHGHQLGRTIGIPTANLTLPGELLPPKFGVYACQVRIGDQEYPAVTNIGTRPTVQGEGITAEPWILDFEGDLYGRDLVLEFYRFLRPERKFPSLEALQMEIRKNAAETREFFRKT